MGLGEPDVEGDEAGLGSEPGDPEGEEHAGRAGPGATSKNANRACYGLSGADFKYRLGNECDFYGEFLFSGTVASNLRYGKPDATDDEMWEALTVAQAADFVRAMPGGRIRRQPALDEIAVTPDVAPVRAASSRLPER